MASRRIPRFDDHDDWTPVDSGVKHVDTIAKGLTGVAIFKK